MISRKKVVLTVLFSILSLMIFSNVIFAAEIELTASHVLAPSHHYQDAFEVMRDIIEARTDGEITMKIHHSASVYEEEEALEAVKDGYLDITTVSPAPMTGFVPEYMACDLPFLFNNIYDAYEFYDGKMGDELFKISEKEGFVGLAWWDNGFRNLTNDVRNIEEPADLDGLKIRTMYSPVHMASMEALGASPTPIAFGELYSALETGVVDGQENPVANIHANRFFEVQDYLTISRHFYDPSPLFISAQTWDKLDEKQKEIVKDAAVIARDHMRSLANRREDVLLAELEEEMNVSVLTEEQMNMFREATKDVSDQFTEEIGEEFLNNWLEAAGM